MRLKEKAKDARYKQKDSEEQDKEQPLNLCGDFFRTCLVHLVYANEQRDNNLLPTSPYQ